MNHVKVEAKQLRSFQIIYVALMYSVVIFYVLLVFQKSGGDGVEAAAIAPTTNFLSLFVQSPFTLVFMAVMFASYQVPRILIQSIRRSPKLQESKNPNDPSTYSVPIIIRGALCDFGAAIGYIAATMSQNTELFIPYGMISILGLILYFPTPARIQNLIAGDSRPV